MELKAADLKLVDDLFGSSTGYVMDFSNRTYAQFFRGEVGIDIYSAAYAEHGNSKGKRLRAFLQSGQRDAIVKALHGLWEYREIYLAGAEDGVPNARGRLNKILERLGGKLLPPDPGTTSQQSSPSVQPGPSETALAELEAEFRELLNMDEDRQKRGYAFERFLKRWFDAWKLEPRQAFKITGEQIDGSFVHGGTVYFLEAKWKNAKIGAADLRDFQELVNQHFEGARGLFISFSGFSVDGLQAFIARRIVMMYGLDIHDALNRRISLDKVIAKKLRIAVEEKRPNVSVRELFP